MAEDHGTSRVVYGANSEAPNHPQKTNFMMVEYPTSLGDEMCIPKGMSHQVSNGEDAVKKFRVPH